MAARGGAWPSRRRAATRVVQRSRFGRASRWRGAPSWEAGFVYAYSLCDDPVIAVGFARGAPGGAVLRPGRGGQAGARCAGWGPVPTRWWSWRDSLGHGPLRRAAGDGRPSGARRDA
jgi:hypothetical protein